MPNPQNTFLWRYLAQQEAQRAQEAAQAQNLVDTTMKMQGQEKADAGAQQADQEQYGKLLSETGQNLTDQRGPVSTGMQRGVMMGDAERMAKEKAFRQALGLKQMEEEGKATIAANTLNQARDTAHLTDARQRDIAGDVGARQRDLETQREAAAMERTKLMDGAMGQRQGMQGVRLADADMQKLGKDLDPFAGMKQDLAVLQSMPEDVPGHGPLVGRIPDMLMPQKDVEYRQAARRILNAVIYLSTGKQLNESETERQLKARGLADTSSKTAFNLGKKELIQEFLQVMKGREAKYKQTHPDIVHDYGAQGGTTSENILPSGDPDDDAFMQWVKSQGGQ